jgi:hypothetical protein
LPKNPVKGVSFVYGVLLWCDFFIYMGWAFFRYN